MIVYSRIGVANQKLIDERSPLLRDVHISQMLAYDGTIFTLYQGIVVAMPGVEFR